MRMLIMKDLLIFNYNSKQDALLVRDLKWILRTVDCYYLSRSWEGGPNIRVTFGRNTDPTKIQEIHELTKLTMKNILIDESEEKQVAEKYKKNASVLAKLEDKGQVSVMEKHGATKVIDNQFFFHNREITDLFNEIRFDLQELVMELYLYLEDNPIAAKEVFPVLFHYVSETYKVNDVNKGYFSFISHVHGFFELSVNQKLSYNESQFEENYQSQKPFLIKFEKEHTWFIQKWFNKWRELFLLLEKIVDGVIDAEYIETMKKTFASLQTNYSNDFHHHFSKYALKEGFVYDDSATAYRFLINLLYMSLPFLRVSALKKQQYIYMAYRYTEDTYNVNWREEIGVK